MKYLILIGFILLTACSNVNHSVQSTLYSKTTPGGTNYDFVQYSGNPIFVDDKSVFEIRINEIMPGWIHQGIIQDKPLEKHNKDSGCTEDKNDGKPCYYTSWTDEIADQLYGKELWIVSKIESVNKNDILERNSKVYFNATNVKLNSLSYKPIPLDIGELNLFSHASDSAYRLTIKVYEVKGFDVKREALKAYDSNPGISGLLVSGWEVIKNTVGALGGEIIESQWKTKSEEDQFIERLLLANGAVVEFQGVMNILRKQNELDVTVGPIGKIQEYMLYDPYKSDDFSSSFDSKTSYQTALGKLENSIDMSTPNIERTYLKFTVEQSLEDIPTVAIGVTGYADAVKFLERVKRD